MHPFNFRAMVPLRFHTRLLHYGKDFRAHMVTVNVFPTRE
jgi:hypothetical protein